MRPGRDDASDWLPRPGRSAPYNAPFEKERIGGMDNAPQLSEDCRGVLRTPDVVLVRHVLFGLSAPFEIPLRPSSARSRKTTEISKSRGLWWEAGIFGQGFFPTNLHFYKTMGTRVCFFFNLFNFVYVSTLFLNQLIDTFTVQQILLIFRFKMSVAFRIKLINDGKFLETQVGKHFVKSFRIH